MALDELLTVRLITLDDKSDILTWRNDVISVEMAFVSRKISQVEHDLWFKDVMEDKSRTIMMGEIEAGKVGICRFDISPTGNCAEVSININPEFRGKGLGKKLLETAVHTFLDQTNLDLFATVKPENKVSQKLFLGSGFDVFESNERVISFRKLKRSLTFREVTTADTKVLYELLRNRQFAISHSIMPSYEEHSSFVTQAPYLSWFIVVRGAPIGTFYIKADNSIGINLNNPTHDEIKQVLDFISRNFTPCKPTASVIPNYFYINVSDNNSELKDTLQKCGLKSIQTSFKL
ncbi:GNAT family N-acetyltransferase [Alphaproteobacteria bacterium LSUCC0719]